jgi:zinc transport system substrate-binding protein
MGKRFSVIMVIVLVAVLYFGGCRQSPQAPLSSEKLQVVVSIAPQRYFVERIGGGYVNVNVMVPPGAEPHTFEPKPEQLKALSRAALYLRIRIDFEDAWMDKIKATNPRMLIVDTTQGIRRTSMSTDSQGGVAEQAGEGENLDPHIWLSPSLVKVQARTIYNALVQLDAPHQAAYKSNLEQFLADIDSLDGDIRQSLQAIKSRKFIVFHPGWGYFAQDYGLEMIPIEVGGQEPSAAELAKLIMEAKAENIRVVFAEPQFSRQAAETIAKEIGGEVLLIDPLSPDWLDNLRHVSDAFTKVLSRGGTLHLRTMMEIHSLAFAIDQPVLRR